MLRSSLVRVRFRTWHATRMRVRHYADAVTVPHEHEGYPAPSPPRHRGGGARAAIFGVSDGLVTNVSLVLGMAGAHPGGSIVRLAGIAGLIGGSFSMAPASTCP